MEGLERPPAHAGVDVVRQRGSFVHRELGRGWAGRPGPGVRGGGAVAHCPHSGVPRHGQMIVYHDRATLVTLDWKSAYERVRSYPRGPHKRFRTDLLGRVEHDYAKVRVGHTGVQLERYATVCHALDGVGSQWCAQLR